MLSSHLVPLISVGCVVVACWHSVVAGWLSWGGGRLWPCRKCCPTVERRGKEVIRSVVSAQGRFFIDARCQNSEVQA